VFAGLACQRTNHWGMNLPDGMTLGRMLLSAGGPPSTLGVTSFIQPLPAGTNLPSSSKWLAVKMR
jgi:hypothetical protein